MDPSIRLGLELPPLVVTAGASLAPADRRRRLVATAQAAERGGFTSLWLTGAGGLGVPDACTLAGGLIAVTASMYLGIGAPVCGAKNPSVLARDVTALDVISHGRAALRLSETPGEWARLAEAAQVCRSLFRSPSSEFDGRWFHLRHAPNLPGPVHPAGPPLLVDLAAESVVELLGAADGLAATLLGSVDALVIDGTPRQVAAVRGLLDTARGSEASDVALLWRGRLGGLDPRESLRSLHQAGADGVIVVLQDARADAVDEVGAVVVEAAGWGG